MHALEASVASFVVAATDGRCERARRLLEARPEIARDPWAALVLGRGWDGDPSAPGGPRGWAPILYVAHSCFAAAELARALLARGADPNATFTNEYGEMSAVYGAAGVRHDPELTRVLLEAGADPNDGESLYHAAEADDTACLRLLLEHGARPAGTNALAHAIDYDHREHVRLLLDAGADPNESRRSSSTPSAASAAPRCCACSPSAAPSSTAAAASGRRRRARVPHRLPERRAAQPRRPRRAAGRARRRHVRRARRPRRRGGGARRAPGDAAARREPEADAQEALILAALRGHLDLVVDAARPALLRPRRRRPARHAAPSRVLGRRPATSSRGCSSAARTPSRRPAPSSTRRSPGRRSARSTTRRPGRDYVGVVERLLAAGAELEPRFADVAEGPLADWLEERT